MVALWLGVLLGAYCPSEGLVDRDLGVAGRQTEEENLELRGYVMLHCPGVNTHCLPVRIDAIMG